MLETVLGDEKHAARSLRKSSVSTAVVILVVALGSGAETTIFSAMNAMRLRPLRLPGRRMPRALEPCGAATPTAGADGACLAATCVPAACLPAACVPAACAR